MSVDRLQIGFFFLFILAVLYLNFLIFLPYLSILFLALVFAIIFDPLYERILLIFTGKKTFAALTSVLLVLLVIVGPIAFFGTLLFQEASDLYTNVIADGEGGSFRETMGMLETRIEDFFPGFSFSGTQGDLAKYTQQGLSWLLNNLTVFFGGFLKIAFGLFLMLLALFYFFRDGKKFIESLIDLSPLSDASDRRLVDRVVVAVNSVVRGHIVIGVLQGLMTGIGLAIFGVPSPVIWGFVAAIASLVPTIGTTLVLIPGILFLFLSGSTGGAIGLIVWGILAVGLIDNLLGPVLIERGVKIHPLLILLSALGGLAFLGPVGFLAGPVVLALLFALLDMYPSMVRKEMSQV